MQYKASRRKPSFMENKKWVVSLIILLVVLIFVAIGILIFRLANSQAEETMADPAGAVSADNTEPPDSSLPKPDNSSAEPISSAGQNSPEAKESSTSSGIVSTNSEDVPAVTPPAEQTGDYQEWFPDLSFPKPEYTTKDKTAYLTFDDGPSENTDKVLDILKEKGVKATFFVVGKEGPDAQRRMQRIVNEGHTIAIHSYTHDYKKIYASPGAFLEDFEHISTLVKSYTGVKPNIFRFPGGTVNSYNKNVYKDITAEMLRRGYTFYDWNVSSGDASSSGATKQQCIDNVLSDSKNKNRAVILCHDAADKKTTVEALPAIIDGLIEQGFTLESLDNTVKPITFPYE